MRNVVITSACRTAVGAYLGTLKTVEAQDMAAEIIKEACKRSGIGLDQLDQVILGDVYGYTPNVARCAALLAGVPIEVPAYSVDRQCASAMQALMGAVNEIKAEEADIILAGGVETMSRFTFYLPPETRFEPFRAGNKVIYDTFTHGTEMVQPQKLYPNLNMGLTAENIAKRYSITREEQDAFAADSQKKMAEAQAAGKFDEEIMPLTVPQKKADPIIFKKDEHNRPGTTVETLAKLKPSFIKDGTGTVTAGNSSGMNDGASAVVVMAEEKAQELGIKPLVKVLTVVAAGCEPSEMGMGPVPAIKKALAKTGLKLEDIDLFELNEAFAAQSLGCLKELGMDMDTEMYKRVNVNGGAIAHGHALGNSGTRILTTLIYEMKRRDAKYGLATLCIGGGQGMACIVENIK